MGYSCYTRHGSARPPCVLGHLYRFDTFAVDCGREYERVGFQIVFVGKHAMVHGLALLPYGFNAVQYLDADFPRRKTPLRKTALWLRQTRLPVPTPCAVPPAAVPFACAPFFAM